jgi:acetoin utilization deacetylase AcuC-like enzyme
MQQRHKANFAQDVRVRAFHCDGREVPLPPGHRFPMQKYRLLRERLLAERIFDAEELIASDLIDREALLGAHEREYVDAVFAGTLSEHQLRRLGFPWSEGLVHRSLASVYGTVAAARVALADGIACNLAGGTHHASAAEGSGFCVFNDIAVAARLLQREGLVERVVIVDLDVHQGDGTASIFAGDPTVFTFSMHGAKNFPFRKQRSALDVELADGCGDTEYLATLAEHLPRVLDQARAQIAFFQAGVDPLDGDSLGRLKLSLDGLRRRDRFVLESARDLGLPIVTTLGGGYAKPIALSVEAHLGTFREVRAAFEDRPQLLRR